MRPLPYYIHHPERILLFALCKCAWALPDKLFLQLRYRLEIGSKLNLANPQRFSEKLQWLKLYNRNAEQTKMVDKAAVKHYVTDKIGAEHVIPTLGIWEHFDDIDFDALPERFVLKTTHGGGGSGVVICKNKSTFDKSRARRLLEHSLKSGGYHLYREWPYCNVPRRIIAEQYVVDEAAGELKDYKFFCFNGEPRLLKVDFGRFTEHHANYYDLDWLLLNIGETDLLPVPEHVEVCPKNFDEMVRLARILSENLPFARIDLYNVDGQIYFGEITFFPASGLLPFVPDSADFYLGSLLTLPAKTEWKKLN
jgi:hypothetical protein